MGCYLAMDIGGTKTSGAVFSEDGSIVDDFIHITDSPTFQGEEAVYQNAKGVLDFLLQHFSLEKHELLGIGVGSPGPLNTQQGLIVHAPLMGWKNFPLVKRLEADFCQPVCLDKDCNLGALAEQRCGQAMGLQNVTYMTVSTGCGSGYVLNGTIYHGRSDGAGEIGHISLDPQGLPCPCGSRGCFELYASGSALNRIMREDLAGGSIGSMVFTMADKDPQKINGAILHQAAEAGDSYALNLLRQEGRYLGFGIATLCNLLDPDIVVLGGGVVKSRDYFHNELMAALRQHCIHAITDDFVQYSQMNDRVVLYGAYYLIKENRGDKNAIGNIERNS